MHFNYGQSNKNLYEALCGSRNTEGDSETSKI